MIEWGAIILVWVLCWWVSQHHRYRVHEVDSGRYLRALKRRGHHDEDDR